MKPLALVFLTIVSTATVSIFTTGCHTRVSTPSASLPHNLYVAKSPIEPGRRFRRSRRSKMTRERWRTSGERYDHKTENSFQSVPTSPLSTFSVDVDTASYANVRRMIRQKVEVPRGAVRVEEMINYFDYDYPDAKGDLPFSVVDEVAGCPWKPKHKLVRVAIQGKKVNTESRGRANLVFLADVSGSMSPENKLPLLKRSLRMLTHQLRPDDRIAIAVYAGSSGLVLPSTPCSDAENILNALDNLNAGGSTAGGEGIELAYAVARKNFQRGGINRVILATDGDFNVGKTSDSDLVDLIEEKAKSGVFLSVLGFGMDNLNDAMLEKLSGKGNGNYAYIDTLNEARKVMVREAGSNLVTIAKDVKLQVEFNPSKVKAYRLIGYENRMLKDRDFVDDKKDAGEIGAGHQVTAFYEMVPVGVAFHQPEVQNLKYRRPATQQTASSSTDELMTVKLRYKQPDAKKSRELSYPIRDSNQSFARASPDFRFASAVAAFGMKLGNSAHSGRASNQQILSWAKSGIGADPFGYRKEFTDLIVESSRM